MNGAITVSAIAVYVGIMILGLAMYGPMVAGSALILGGLAAIVAFSVAGRAST